MNLLAKREHEVPAALEKVFPGMDELVRTMFGRMIEPGCGLLRSSVFDSKWDHESGWPGSYEYHDDPRPVGASLRSAA